MFDSGWFWADIYLLDVWDLGFVAPLPLLTFCVALSSLRFASLEAKLAAASSVDATADSGDAGAGGNGNLDLEVPPTAAAALPILKVCDCVSDCV